MKFKKSTIKILAIVTILIVEISLYFVAGTYSKYTSSAESNSTARTAKWAVKIGSIDLAGGATDFTNELVLETTNSAKVKTGTIAPSTSVQGSFNINPNGTEVAIKYIISLGTIHFKNALTNADVTENTPNIEITNITPSTGSLTQNLDGTYTGTIDLDGDSVDITITAEWNSTDNSQDTANGYTPLTVIVPVNLTVEQDI